MSKSSKKPTKASGNPKSKKQNARPEIAISLVRSSLAEIQMSPVPEMEMLSTKGEIAFEIETKVSTSLEEELAVVLLSISGRPRDTENGKAEPFIRAVTRHDFHLANLRLYEEEDGVRIPGHLLATMVATSFATSRGLMVSLTSFSPNAGLLLPIIPLVKLLPNNMNPPDFGIGV